MGDSPEHICEAPGIDFNGIFCTTFHKKYLCSETDISIFRSTIVSSGATCSLMTSLAGKYAFLWQKEVSNCTILESIPLKYLYID